MSTYLLWPVMAQTPKGQMWLARCIKVVAGVQHETKSEDLRAAPRALETDLAFCEPACSPARPSPVPAVGHELDAGFFDFLENANRLRGAKAVLAASILPLIASISCVTTHKRAVWTRIGPVSLRYQQLPLC